MKQINSLLNHLLLVMGKNERLEDLYSLVIGAMPGSLQVFLPFVYSGMRKAMASQCL